ncbi:hypothetical protein MHAS_04786 [Mycolicibacterium hassiacum DSM 44199]|nr:hypothetical protein MHAS_04786 [Mycolicibacterium hassiacum DSM 44199]
MRADNPVWLATCQGHHQQQHHRRRGRTQRPPRRYQGGDSDLRLTEPGATSAADSRSKTSPPRAGVPGVSAFGRRPGRITATSSRTAGYPSLRRSSTAASTNPGPGRSGAPPSRSGPGCGGHRPDRDRRPAEVRLWCATHALPPDARLADGVSGTGRPNPRRTAFPVVIRAVNDPECYSPRGGRHRPRHQRGGLAHTGGAGVARAGLPRSIPGMRPLRLCLDRKEVPGAG